MAANFLDQVAQDYWEDGLPALTSRAQLHSAQLRESAKIENTSEEMQILEIGELVILAAEEIFELAGCKQDFCIQHVGECAVFGGSNRLLWSPVKGFRYDAPYCSPRFLKAFGQWMGAQPKVYPAATP